MSSTTQGIKVKSSIDSALKSSALSESNMLEAAEQMAMASVHAKAHTKAHTKTKTKSKGMLSTKSKDDMFA